MEGGRRTVEASRLPLTSELTGEPVAERRFFLSVADVGDARLAASGAAAALAMSGRGNLGVLALLLAFAAGPLAGTVSVLSLGAVALRWGTTSLAEIAGTAAVLGPPVRVGPWLAAAAVACAGGALVIAGLAGPSDLAPRLAVGATAGTVVAGPAGAPDLPAALLGLAAAAVFAAAAGKLAVPDDRIRAMRFVAVFLGVVALLLGASR